LNNRAAEIAPGGFDAVSVNAELVPGNTYGAIFLQAVGDWVLDPEIQGGVLGFQARYNQMIAEGRRLYRVQGYDDGQKFAAIWVKDEQKPFAVAGPSTPQNCPDASGGQVQLNGSGSTFDSAFPIGYEWTGPFGVVADATPVVSLPVGTHTLTLRVFDSRGYESTATRTVSVTQGSAPPVLTVPPAVEITSCVNVQLGTPVAVDVCGGPVTVTNDAPDKFPLGPTVVTWTATNQFGVSTTRTQVVTAQLADDPSCCPDNTNYIPGTSNNDSLTGTAGNDCIIGFGGQDVIDGGGGGNDAISGGEGDDAITGGTGNDRLYGGSGQDNIDGGSGDDFLSCGGGDDVCRGGAGSDQVSGGSGQDQLFGNDGDDTLLGNDGDDTLDGGPGIDFHDGGGLHDQCTGDSSDIFFNCDNQPDGVSGSPPSGTFNAQFTTFADWGLGYCVTLLVSNGTQATASNWSVMFDVGDAVLTDRWNGAFGGDTGVIAVIPGFDWNATIAPGATDSSIGFCAVRNGAPGPGVISATASF
jgi:hypothetical protein